MPISFNDIPTDVRTPFVFVEFDATQAQASGGSQRYRALIIGQKLSTGNVAELVPTVLTRVDEVGAAFGQGSMLESMARTFFANTNATEAVFVAIDDPAGGTKGAGSVQFAVSSPQPGRVAVYVGGRRYSIPTTSASTANSLAAALAAAITADPFAHATASASTDTCTITARHAGVAAGAIDIRHSYHSDERLPVGVTATVTAMSGGAGDVDLAEVIAVLGDEQYHVLACPYTDAANLTLLEAELADRFGPERQIDGVAFCAVAGNLSAAQTLGNARNSPHVSIMSSWGSPSPVWDVAAGVAAVAAHHGSIDPARPFQTLAVAGVLAPAMNQRFTRAERDLLLHDGISTSVTNAAGVFAIERLVTTYQTSPQGAADTAYLDVNTLLTLSFLRYDFRTTFQTKYPRHKLASDGVRYGAGQAVMTPSLARAEAIAIARGWEERGLIEALDQFKAQVVVERDNGDPTRLNFYLPPDLVNGLRVVAAQIGFRL